MVEISRENGLGPPFPPYRTSTVTRINGGRRLLAQHFGWRNGWRVLLRMLIIIPAMMAAAASEIFDGPTVK